MNSQINNWAIRHRVSAQALAELQDIFVRRSPGQSPKNLGGLTESAVQAAVRLEAARKGIHLFRNNVGVLKNEAGVPVRYGLANDSKNVNAVMKSGDLIGWRPLQITTDHVGQTVALFVSRECKRPGWIYTGSDRERAQLAWAQLVIAGGGDASFCTGEGSFC